MIGAFGFAVLALLSLSISLGSVFSAAPQGKGGEVVAKPTPKKTATPKRTSTPANRRRTGRGNTPATDPQHETITNRIGMEFVWVPPGSFMMGSENGGEKPVHQVAFVVNEQDAARARMETPNAETQLANARVDLKREMALLEQGVASRAEFDGAQTRYNLAKIKLDSLRTTTGEYGFYMGKYEVTQAQWRQVMGTTPSQHRDCANCPVELVSWEDAQQFLDKLNDANDAYRYRLPTEAEWEYACRAGTSDDEIAKLDLLAWYRKNSDGKTHPVGRLRPNAFGLYDMRGNVWEWCLDWYHENYNGAPTDGSVWLTGGIEHMRTIRGGSWYDGADQVRSTNRMYGSASYHGENIGFRVVAVARDR